MPTARYALLQSSYWSGFCLIVNFASVYLLAQGLSNAEIGMVIAVASALSTVAQPLVAGVADRSRWPLRLWLVAGGLAIAIVGLALLLPGERGLLVAVNYGLLIGSIQLLQPLVNSVGMAVINLGVKVNFGVARASASLAFALLSLAAGRIVEATSEASLPLMLLLVQLVFVVAAATFVFRRAEGGEGLVEAGLEANHPAPLDRRAWLRFALLLLGFTLAMSSHNLVNGFMFQVVTFHGGTAADMGLAIMIAALTELPTMIGWNLLQRRWSPGVLMIVAGVMFAVKSIATWLAPNLAAIYLAQALQFAAFGLIIPASVYYIDRHFPPGQRTTGQAYMTMTATAGSVVGSVVGGIVLDAAGVPSMLLVGELIAVACAVSIAAGADRS